MLERLSLLEKTYIKGGAPELKHSLITVLASRGVIRPSLPCRGTWMAALRPAQRLPPSDGAVARRALRRRWHTDAGPAGEGTLVVVANMHIDSAGDNGHRRRQVGTTAKALY